MKKTQFQIEGSVKVTLEHTDGKAMSEFIRSDIYLDFIGPIDRKKYFNPDELPNGDGCKCLTIAFVSAIANNIHYAHEKGYRDSAEHLRYVIAKLEDQFIQVPKIDTGNFNDKP